jgi:hypothetical protein
MLEQSHKRRATNKTSNSIDEQTCLVPVTRVGVRLLSRRQELDERDCRERREILGF